jgi:hypothetical protein
MTMDMFRCRIHNPAWFITGFVTRVTRRVPPVEQELLTLPEHPRFFSGVRLVRCLFSM